MKSLITAITLAAVIIVGGIYSSYKIDKLSENLLNQNTVLISSINQLDFKNAKEQILKIHDDINNSALLLASYMDHNELDKIQMNIAQLKTYIEEEEKSMALSCAGTLDMLFAHLPKDYHIKLENIF